MFCSKMQKEQQASRFQVAKWLGQRKDEIWKAENGFTVYGSWGRGMNSQWNPNWYQPPGLMLSSTEKDPRVRRKHTQTLNAMPKNGGPELLEVRSKKATYLDGQILHRNES